MFSFRFWSDEENAVMSPPTWRSLLIPTPPANVALPVVLLVEFVVDATSRVPDTIVESVAWLPRIAFPLVLKTPTTFTSLPLISIIPVVESSVRFPAFVSIVLVVASAILILPNVRLPPLTVPATFKLPPI